jgi:sugar/nucleoside kinase (ribokinase family)
MSYSNYSKVFNMKYNVVCIGNAIMDVLSKESDGYLTSRAILKGSMRLIDEAEALSMTKGLSKPHVISGGSAANTAVGVASFGLKAAFIGKTKADDYGALYHSDLNKAGVHFHTAQAKDGVATARSIIIVTDDAERTMNTYLGAAQNLDVSDIESELIASSYITYLEGYLWDPPQAKLAFERAASIAHAHGRKVALTLSDSFCVHRYRDEFLGLLKNGTVDIVFANEAEALALYQTDDIEVALTHFSKDVGLAIVTRSEQGAIAIEGASRVSVPCHPVKKVVDTTGAGDLFAAGFLAGYCQQLGLEQALKLGAIAAAEVISHIGARPLVSLKTLV